MIKLKIIVAAVVVFGGVAGWFYIDSLKAQRDKYKQTATMATQEALGLQVELVANREALLAREQERAVMVAAHETVLRGLNAVYESDQTARSWADTSIPDSVLEWLR